MPLPEKKKRSQFTHRPNYRIPKFIVIILQGFRNILLLPSMLLCPILRLLLQEREITAQITAQQCNLPSNLLPVLGSSVIYTAPLSDTNDQLLNYIITWLDDVIIGIVHKNDCNYSGVQGSMGVHFCFHLSDYCRCKNLSTKCRGGTIIYVRITLKPTLLPSSLLTRKIRIQIR